MELFYNTYERNPLSVLESFSRQPHALTLHPLKAAWMMNTHHQHATKQTINTAKQVTQKTCTISTNLYTIAI